MQYYTLSILKTIYDPAEYPESYMTIRLMVTNMTIRQGLRRLLLFGSDLENFRQRQANQDTTTVFLKTLIGEFINREDFDFSNYHF